VNDEQSKRRYGSGSVIVHRGAWYGRWWVGDQYVKRKLGGIRESGTRDGLTRKQAEMALRRLMTEVRVVLPEERMTVKEAGDHYLHHLEHVKRRKPSTLQDYRIILNKHLVPYFGSKPVDRIAARDIAGYIPAKSGGKKGDGGLSHKTIINHLNFAHGVFAFALKHGWCTSNPVAATDRPEADQADPDIRFLGLAELEALLQVAAARVSIAEAGEDQSDVRAHTDHALYLTAAMTGMREGELIALRWRDVDWAASLIRVRRNYTRGKWGTPKSKRSSRALPMADRLGGELDRHFKRSLYQGDDHLVFCQPQNGEPYDPSQIRKRFYAAMKAAGMGHRCGHDGGITFHSLRHTFGTRMAAAGVPMRTLQEWMGHRNLATTEIYADYAPDPAYGGEFAERAFTAKSERGAALEGQGGLQRAPSSGIGEGPGPGRRGRWH
jgi:integrase